MAAALPCAVPPLIPSQIQPIPTSGSISPMAMPTASELEQKAREAFVDNDFGSAVALYTQAIAVCPSAATLYAGRAEAHIKMGDFAAAAADAARAAAAADAPRAAAVAPADAVEPAKNSGSSDPTPPYPDDMQHVREDCRSREECSAASMRQVVMAEVTSVEPHRCRSQHPNCSANPHEEAPEPGENSQGEEGVEAEAASSMQNSSIPGANRQRGKRPREGKDYRFAPNEESAIAKAIRTSPTRPRERVLGLWRKTFLKIGRNDFAQSMEGHLFLRKSSHVVNQSL
ncbi:unnamed protein product [Urochloa humidicola]